MLLYIFQGKTSLMSAQGTNQLSIFIFVIAVMQVVYSGVTMGLGRAKVLQISSLNSPFWFNYRLYCQVITI